MRTFYLDIFLIVIVTRAASSMVATIEIMRSTKPSMENNKLSLYGPSPTHILRDYFILMMMPSAQPIFLFEVKVAL